MFTEIGAIERLPENSGQHGSAPSGEGNTTLSATISEIRELQQQRKFCIKQQSKCNRSVEAFIARSMGYSTDEDEKARKEKFKRAASFRREVEKDGGGHSKGAQQGQQNAAPAVPLILLSAQSRQAWDAHRKQVEARMRKLAKSLPIWRWADTVRGLGELGVAIIVGESGDLSNYATIERLWKRLGLAVFDGVRQSKRSNVDEAAKHGYSPSRRAEVWTVADSLFKHQWRGEKEGIAAHYIGPYGEAYGRRKAATEGREGWSNARRDNDARRIMTKVLIEDLWKAWRL